MNFVQEMRVLRLAKIPISLWDNGRSVWIAYMGFVSTIQGSGKCEIWYAR